MFLKNVTALAFKKMQNKKRPFSNGKLLVKFQTAPNMNVSLKRHPSYKAEDNAVKNFSKGIQSTVKPS